MSKSKAFTVEQVVRPREQVQRRLEAAILAGEFSTGAKLPSENALAEMFGVSRPTIREALGALVSSGMVRKVPGASGGTFVREVDAKALGLSLQDSLSHVIRLGSIDIEEVSEAREILEVPSARMAAQNRTDEDVAAAAAIVARQRQINLHDPEVSSLDQEFHQIIAEASGNRLLAAFVGALHACTVPVTYLKLTPDVGRETILQHSRIIKAVEAGDENAAGEAMREHLVYVRSASATFPQ